MAVVGEDGGAKSWRLVRWRTMRAFETKRFLGLARGMRLVGVGVQKVMHSLHVLTKPHLKNISDKEVYELNETCSLS